MLKTIIDAVKEWRQRQQVVNSYKLIFKGVHHG